MGIDLNPPIRKVNPDMQKLMERLAKLEARIIKLETAVEFMKCMNMHPKTRMELNKVLEKK